ncbi:hypothetical protein BGX26_010932 [Mortierella sp. AD094]|nr:hypothetical protein BGX26_010932 [Mortierella sp. AD094]
MSQGMHPQQFMQQQPSQSSGPTIQQLKNKMSRGDLKSQQLQQQQREPTPRSLPSQDPDAGRRMTTREDSSNGRLTAAQSNRGDAYDNGNGYDADSRLVNASVDSYHHEDDQYWFTVRVDYSNGMTRNLSRLYEDFYNFHIALLEEFPVESGRVGDQPRILPFMPIPLQVVTDTVTASRRADLDGYVKELCGLPARITQHPLVDQIFALREGDTETPTGASGNGTPSPSVGRSTPSNNMFHSATSAYNTDRRPSTSGGPRAVFASKVQGSGNYRSYNDEAPSANASPSLRSQASFATVPPPSGASEEMIKVKISYQEDIMAMRIPVSITFRSLQQKIFERVNTDQKELSYRDDRGDFARIQDDADYQLDPIIIIIIMTTEKIFIDAPIQDQAIELATYIDALRGDETGSLVKEITALVDSNKVVDAVKILVRESKTLLEAPEKEFESAYNLLVAIILPDNDKAALETVLKILITEPTQKTPLKFKVLSNIFNILPANSPLRLSVFSSIVDLAVASDDMDLVLPQLQYVPSWISEWSVGVEAERTLLLTLADRLKESGNPYQSLEFLIKYLTSFNNHASELNSQKAHATKAIVESIALPEVLNFENLLKIDAVQHIKSEKIYDLLTIFMNGNVQDYRTFVAKNENAGLVKEQGLDEEETLRKIRLLSLASLGSENLSRDLSYQDIAKALEVDEDQVELWVIDVIRAGLVEAKLNQVSRVVIISRSIYRTFGTQQWQQLSQRLNGWKQSLAEILQVLANAKLTSAAVSTAVITNN